MGKNITKITKIKIKIKGYSVLQLRSKTLMDSENISVGIVRPRTPDSTAGRHGTLFTVVFLTIGSSVGTVYIHNHCGNEMQKSFLYIV